MQVEADETEPLQPKGWLVATVGGPPDREVDHILLAPCVPGSMVVR